MKKLLSLLSISLLALVLAVPAFAAAKPIDVYINGSKVTFTAGSPFLQNNSVLVPFRVVFEKLGLQVLWDAKTQTVTGKSADLVISLKVGSNRATVNGTVKKLTLAPVSQSGTTYIPLRFIAEATGGTAVWNPANRSVQIDTAVSKTADEAAITALINLSNQYYNEEKAISFYSLMDSESSYTESVSDLNTTFEQYDLKNTIDNLEILSLKANEATVYTIEHSVRTGGYYMPDQQIEYLYTLVRKNGVWKISDFKSQNSTVLLTRDQALIAADVPQADSTAIKDNINKYYQYLNAENTEGVISTMTSYGEEYNASVKANLNEFFTSYNITYTPGISNIYYYGAGEAAIYVESKDKEASEAETYEQGNIFILSKADNGSWTINDTYNVSYELSK
ncbi:copper amine oxidase N-terminal domain-containing protein [Paenibacillus sp. 19GGS1-52]|uniref:copper amine oxidase N-terminal domain-containing protein n=1 Tax=Paenibacillus sp. 19GGS1-52 TaxID=2758563 RepID=UPI001EFA9A0B|nr:copper amine oxidase N-terminal domain-containing protein [Paenibacillus sp. 19GGS1-52]ULO08373.1 copper amine oxidase N-terminal domain-containing protein [Paenibacillus sp. 19GGS1-52]